MSRPPPRLSASVSPAAQPGDVALAAPDLFSSAGRGGRLRVEIAVSGSRGRMVDSATFDVGRKYSPRQLLQLLGLPEDATRGTWFNGYQRHGDAFYIFANMREDHRQVERRDHWEDQVLFWSAKGKARLSDAPIRDLASGQWPVHIFWRYGHEGDFTYAGLASLQEARDTTPATLLWICGGA